MLCFTYQCCFATILQGLNIEFIDSEIVISDGIHFKDYECRMMKCLRCGQTHDSRQVCPEKK